jgi:hypothetical protein
MDKFMGPVVVDNYLSDDLVQELVSFLDPLLRETPREAMRGALGYETSAIAASVGNGTPAVLGFEGTSSESTVRALENLYKRVQLSMEEYFGVEMDLVNCNYQEMSKGGSNPLHSDSTKLDGSPWRDDGVEEELEFSALVYLNTVDVDFTGGEIEFPLQDILVKPKAGQLVYFRGDVDHIHEVKTVTSGLRKVLVFFFARKGNISSVQFFVDGIAGGDPFKPELPHS